MFHSKVSTCSDIQVAIFYAASNEKQKALVAGGVTQRLGALAGLLEDQSSISSTHRQLATACN